VESETLCCWKQQCFALLLLQKQNEGGTNSLIADPELLIDPSIRIVLDSAGMLLRGVAAATAAADRSSAVVPIAGVKSIDPECCH